MTSRFWLSVIGAIAVVTTLVTATERRALKQEPQRHSTPSAVAGSSRPCKAEVACCPAALKNFVRVGGHPPLPPKPITRVEPDLTKVARPYPCGVAILELGIDERAPDLRCLERRH